MMAYLLRPRQKFAIGGGVVEGEDLGSREGFSKIYRINKGYGPEVSTEKNVKKGFIYPRKNKDGKVLWKKAEDISKNNPIEFDFTKKPPLPEMDNPRYKFSIALNKWVFLSRAEGERLIPKEANETFKQFTKRINERAEEFRGKGADKRISTIVDARNKIDDWTTKWLNENLDKYGIRKSQKFFDDLKKDYKKFIKQTFKSDKIAGVNLFSPDNLPNVSRSLTENLQPFEYDGFKTINVGEDVTKNPTKLTPNTPYFKKIFFKNKIQKTPGFFNDLKNYFKYIITNKATLEGKKATRNFIPNKDVIYFLDSDKSGLLDSVKNDVISSLGDDVKQSYDLYKNKVNIGLNWNRNAKIIEDTLGPQEMKKLTGYETIKEGMAAEQKIIKKLFDFKELPKDLKLGYAIDHGQGISFAARSGNKAMMKLAVTDLIGSMIKTNEVLGRGERGTISFERQRKILANKIREGENANTNLSKLNKLVEKTYGKKNVYSIKNGVLQSSPISPNSDLKSRFISYFEKLNKTSEGKDLIKKQYGNLNNLKESISKLNIKLGDDTATITKKIKEAPIPNRFKTLLYLTLGPIAVGTAAITGADLLTSSAQAAETGQLPQGSPAQINPVDEEGFTTTEKLLAGTTAGGAAYAARKPLLRTLGKVVRPFGFPSVAAGFAAGELLSDDPNLGIAGAELLAPELIKTVAPRGSGIMSQIGRFAANPFFKGARAFTPVGLGLMGIEGIRMGMREQDRIDAMSPEEREDFIAEQESLLDFSA